MTTEGLTLGELSASYMQTEGLILVSKTPPLRCTQHLPLLQGEACFYTTGNIIAVLLHKAAEKILLYLPMCIILTASYNRFIIYIRIFYFKYNKILTE